MIKLGKAVKEIKKIIFVERGKIIKNKIEKV
jgi:hypothetical protein